MYVAIIEDETCISEALSEMILGWGYEVSIANTCADALYVLAKKEPDIVLLDLILNGKPENDLIYIIRKMYGDRPKIIIMTAMSQAAKVLSNSPIDKLITKPFDISELENSLLIKKDIDVSANPIYNAPIEAQSSESKH